MKSKASREEYIKKIEDLKKKMDLYKRGLNPGPDFNYAKAAQELMRLKRGLSLIKDKGDGKSESND